MLVADNAARDRQARVGQLLVALENVYAVLRSKHPIEPVRALVADLAQDALKNASGVFGDMDQSARRLRQAVDALGAPTMLPSPERPDILDAIDDIGALLQ
jgi:hypothetical protein